jgi:ribosome-associated heat shock protein Hsp15
MGGQSSRIMANQAADKLKEQVDGGWRIDKWLHHTRVFKTRSLAGQACSKGNVKIAGQTVKASRSVRVQDLISVERGELKLTLRVLGYPPQRVGAARVAEFLEDQTPAAEYERVAAIRREQALIQPRAHEMVAKPNKQQLRVLREWLDHQSE